MYVAKLWILLPTFNNYCMCVCMYVCIYIYIYIYIYSICISDFQCHKSLFDCILSVVTAVPRCINSIDHGITINKNCHQCKTGKLSLLVRVVMHVHN